MYSENLFANIYYILLQEFIFMEEGNCVIQHTAEIKWDLDKIT